MFRHATACFRTLVFLLLFPLIQGCGSDEVSPEQQIRQMITAGELAVESRSISAVQAYISDQYSDDTGNQKRTLSRLLGGYFIAHQSIHLLSQVSQIELQGEAQAKVTLFVATAGRPISSPADFLSLNADLLRFDLSLAKESSQWRVDAAHWRRANAADFLE